MVCLGREFKFFSSTFEIFLVFLFEPPLLPRGVVGLTTQLYRTQQPLLFLTLLSNNPFGFLNGRRTEENILRRIVGLLLPSLRVLCDFA